MIFSSLPRRGILVGRRESGGRSVAGRVLRGERSCGKSVFTAAVQGDRPADDDHRADDEGGAAYQRAEHGDILPHGVAVGEGGDDGYLDGEQGHECGSETEIAQGAGDGIAEARGADALHDRRGIFDDGEERVDDDMRDASDAGGISADRHLDDGRDGNACGENEREPSRDRCC